MRFLILLLVALFWANLPASAETIRIDEKKIAYAGDKVSHNYAKRVVVALKNLEDNEVLYVRSRDYGFRIKPIRSYETHWPGGFIWHSAGVYKRKKNGHWVLIYSTDHMNDPQEWVRKTTGLIIEAQLKKEGRYLH